MNDNYIISMLIKNGKINSHYKQIICKDKNYHISERNFLNKTSNRK